MQEILEVYDLNGKFLRKQARAEFYKELRRELKSAKEKKLEVYGLTGELVDIQKRENYTRT